VSTYGLVAGLSVCLFGSTAGRYVDGTNRLVAAQFFIWTENVCVLVATAFCYRLLQARQERDDDGPPTLIPDDAMAYPSSGPSSWLQSLSRHVPLDHLSIFCLLGIHVFGPIAQILDRGFLVAIERDWVVIMSESAVEEPVQQQQLFVSDASDSSLSGSASDRHEDQQQRQAAARKGWLSETNVTMKQIDLSCKVVAPAIAGFIIGAFDSQQHGIGVGDGGDPGAEVPGDASLSQRSGSNLKGAAVLVGVVNVAALVVEYYCTRQIYQMIPALAVKREGRDESQLPQHNPGGDSVASQHGLLQLLAVSSPLPRGRTGGSGVEHWAIVERPWRVPPALQIYLDQPVSKAGLALSLLYVGFGCLLISIACFRGNSRQSCVFVSTFP
jgi:Ferroportin1 (FPN1)